ncbi:hypothetical protein U3516DRAFT_757810 [Neocallimastix sp. 'constans']
MNSIKLTRHSIDKVLKSEGILNLRDNASNKVFLWLANNIKTTLGNLMRYEFCNKADLIFEKLEQQQQKKKEDFI